MNCQHALVLNQGYSVTEAANSLGVTSKAIYNWIKYDFIKTQRATYPINIRCKVMNVSRSVYYAWDRRPAQLITETELKLYRCCKRLFNASRQSLGSRQMMKNLRKESFNVGRYKVMILMKQLGLYVKQRTAYKATTMGKHSHSVADNIPNQVWARDVTYLRTAGGWMYLSIIMDLYSCRIIGWSGNTRMTADLVKSSMQMALTLRQPNQGVLFHSDRGSQYTSNSCQT